MTEYTLLAASSVILVAVLDWLLKTHLLRQKAFWVFMAVIAGFKVITNGYLTWRPIVLYGEQYFLNIRLGTIPVEDFLFGFSLVGLSVILWEYFKRTGRRDAQ